jgi:hypothetical protein
LCGRNRGARTERAAERKTTHDYETSSSRHAGSPFHRHVLRGITMERVARKSALWTALFLN